MSTPALEQYLLRPEWPAPAHIQSCVTTCIGGVSHPPFGTFNLATHVGDDPQLVAQNRHRLETALGCRPAWLSQAHGCKVTPATPEGLIEADASWTEQLGVACAILTADCLPVLFCDRAGSTVAAAHTGWRGLYAGILEHTVTRLAIVPAELLVWLGPAIGPQAFEVGPEVYTAFVSKHAESASAFAASTRPGYFCADLYQLARIRLSALGIDAIYGGGYCTFNDPRFYSYRRTPQTGRFASLIWRTKPI